MNKALVFGILSILMIATTYSLNLKHLSPQFLHLATEQQKQAYLQELIRIQNQLSDQVNQLNDIANQYTKKIDKEEGAPDIQKQILEDAFEEQRGILYSIESGISLPLTSKSWGCQNLTKQEAQKVNNQIIQTQKKIHILEDKILGQPSCPVTDQTQKQIRFLKFYISHLSQQLQNLCEKPPSFNTFYLPSPGSDYIYGRDGQQAFRNKTKKALDDGFKLANCPVNTPYPKQKQCMACPQDSHIYDLTELACLQCPDKYYFVKQNHTCNKKPLNTHPQAKFFMGEKPQFNPLLDNCPQQKPFFNSKQCVSCDKPSYFNFGTNNCDSCGKGLVFNLVTRLCGYIPYNTNPAGSNVCCGTIVNNPNQDTCPQQTPFFNGKQCIQCDLPSYFSLTNYTCEFCPEGQGFSTKIYQCVDLKFLQPTYNSTITQQTSNYFGLPPKIDDRYEIVNNCDVETPYYDGDSCIACELPSYFSFQTNQCLVCPSQYKFSVKYHKCLHLNTQKHNNNMTSINNFRGRVPRFDPTVQTCPGDRPFYDGLQCIECPLPKYVDFEHHSCLQCQEGTIFDLFNRQCIIDPQNHYTNLNADKIYYNGDYGIIEKQIENVKHNNPSAEECHIDTPYYNAVIGRCQICPNQTPLFDYKYNRCIKCPENSEFRQDKHICLTSGNITPTLERMMMNTINFA